MCYVGWNVVVRSSLGGKEEEPTNLKKEGDEKPHRKKNWYVSVRDRRRTRGHEQMGVNIRHQTNTNRSNVGVMWSKETV